VEVEIAEHFILTLPVIRIAATISQELGLAMTVVIARHPENAQ